MGFRATVVASVLSTLIATFIIWLSGFWPMLWSSLSTTAAATVSAMWSIVAYIVPVPLGVLALLGIALAYSLVRILSGMRPSKVISTTETSTEQTEQDAQILSENELKVVHLLAAADGRWAKLSDIAADIRLSRLITEQALEKLFARGFLRDSHNTLHGTSFRLSSEGRDYAIEKGLIQ